jgi:hypothetical protein
LVDKSLEHRSFGCLSKSISKQERTEMDSKERFATMLGHAAIEVWGDMPRDIQEALFAGAMKGHEAEREELARLLHDRHPHTAPREGGLKAAEPGSA